MKISNQKFYIINNASTYFLSSLCDAVATVFLIQKGFSILSISGVYSFGLIVGMLLEYPSGILADKYGRKKIYSIGLFFRALQCLIFIRFPTLFGIYIGIFAESLYSSFVSGSLEAWLKDSNNISKVNYNYLFGRSKMLSCIISIILLLVSNHFLSIEFDMIYVFCLVCYCLLTLINLFYKQDNKGGLKTKESYTQMTLRKYQSNAVMKELSVILSSAFAFISIYMLFFQAKSDLIGVDNNFYIFASALSLIGGVIANFLYSKYRPSKSRYSVIILCFFGVFISFCCFLLSTNEIHLLIGNFVYGLSISCIIPVFYSWMMELIHGDNLATSISMVSAFSSVAAAVTTIFVGFIIEKTSLNVSLYIGISLSLFATIFTLKLRKEQKHV